MKVVRTISRILVGLVFIFSGFVKAVDPWGTAIKFHDYFVAMGIEGLMPYAFALAVLMIVAEFIIGCSLFFNIKVKWGAWGAFLFLCLFTPITLWLAITNSVSDCGCFGDAVTLSNWQTFFKNVILILLAIFIVWQRKGFKQKISPVMQWNIVGIFTIFIGFIIGYSYVHLPIIDFLPCKEGTHLPDLMTAPKDAPRDEYAQIITLKDTITGKQIDIDVNTYTNDSNYWKTGTKYKYISISEPKLIKKGYITPIHDFNIFDENNNNYIDTVLQYKGYAFLFVSPKIENASTKNIDRIKSLYALSIKQNYKFFALTASLKQNIDTFIIKHNIPFSFYMCDETTLETMVRSNPGLILIKNGTVIKKWSYFDFPDETDIEKITSK